MRFPRSVYGSRARTIVPATAMPANIVIALASQTGGNLVKCVMRRDRTRIGDNVVAYRSA